MNNALFTSKSQTWNTPAWFIRLIVAVFGRIQLDPCSNRWSVVNAVTTFADDRGEDGRRHIWANRGLVFVNPPFNTVADFMKKCVEADECIALVPARSDTAWFHDACDTAAVLILWRGRLSFKHEGEEGVGAPFPSAVFYWGPRAKQFVNAFGKHGVVVDLVVHRRRVA